MGLGLPRLVLSSRRKANTLAPRAVRHEHVFLTCVLALHQVLFDFAWFAVRIQHAWCGTRRMQLCVVKAEPAVYDSH